MDNKVQQINLLREQVQNLPPDQTAEIERLQEQIAELRSQIDQGLTPWDQVQLARHPERPYTLDYVSRVFSGFRELHGDRKFYDDPAMIGGMARLNNEPVLIIGHQKGRNTKQRIYRNYGMPKPEGYRKAVRLMKLAEKFRRPILAFIDTPGAYPGLGAEERGQAQAIAFNLRTMAQIRVPLICVVIGEGGSGGALAIALGDRILMQEHSIYSVISPESCSAILWKDQEHAREAAASLKLTPEHLLKHKVVDEIVPEPSGGAHLNYDEAASLLKDRLVENLRELAEVDPRELIARRHQKFRQMGQFYEEKA